MMDILSGEADSLTLPIVTRLIPPGMGDTLAAFSRTLEAAVQGQPVDQTAVSAGVQALLSIAALPPAPAIPGMPWTAWELAGRDAHGSMLRVESAAGDVLSLHCDAAGTPTVASWERMGTEQVATFYLTQGAAGWEFVIDTGTSSSRHAITIAPGLTWASADIGAGVVGAAIAKAKSRAAQTPASATPPESTSLPNSAPLPAPNAAPRTEVDNAVWHYLQHDEQCGPVTEDELRRLYAAGTLTGETLVWSAALTEWQPVAAALPDLIPAKTSPPPPTPPPPAPPAEPAATSSPEPVAAPPASLPPAPAWPSPAPTPIPKPEPISWHYLLQGQSQGPVAEDDLRGWLAEGRLAADILVWNPTFSEWQPAQEVGLIAPEPARRFCGQCGAQLPPEARFCGGCGNALG